MPSFVVVDRERSGGELGSEWVAVGFESDSKIGRFWPGLLLVRQDVGSMFDILVSLFSFRYDCNEGRLSGRRFVNCSSILAEDD